MSMFLCPLCGKQNSIKKYRPENFDDDVEIFHNASLGYRRGFEKVLGFDLVEFPELREKIVNRIFRISEFLKIETEVNARVKELEQMYEDERDKRISAQEELEEQDIDLLLNKINLALGGDYSNVHSAVDELISRAISINNSNQNLRSINQSLQSRCTNLEAINENLASSKNQLKKDNDSLHEIINKWNKAYRDLEAEKNQKISEYYRALNNERNRSTALEDKIEELDLDFLFNLVNKETGHKHTNLHSAINELIRDFNLCESEIKKALYFINYDVLPEEYDIFYDLGEALEALFQYYEDQIEELSDE